MTTPDGGIAAAANTLRIIKLAMAGGIGMLLMLCAWFSANGHRLPLPQEFATMRLLTIVALLFAVSILGAAPLVCRAARGPSPSLASLQTAHIVRAAMGEGASMLGGVVCLLGAFNGVLRAQPLYWINAAPGFVFIAWVLQNLPTDESLRAELGP